MSKVRWLLSLALVLSLGVHAYAQDDVETEEEEEVTEAVEPAPSQNGSAAEAAAAAYDKGDCEAATTAYRALRENPQVTPDERDLATFRIGYCAYNAGDLEVAVSEFQALLLRRPEEDEARLRLAECQLSQEEFREAAENAAKVSD